MISFTACYEQLPDPELLAQCLRDSFKEYLALLRPAAGRKPRAAAPKTARHKPVAAVPRTQRRKAAVRGAAR